MHSVSLLPIFVFTCRVVVVIPCHAEDPLANKFPLPPGYISASTFIISTADQASVTCRECGDDNVLLHVVVHPNYLCFCTSTSGYFSFLFGSGLHRWVEVGACPRTYWSARVTEPSRLLSCCGLSYHVCDTEPGCPTTVWPRAM